MEEQNQEIDAQTTGGDNVTIQPATENISDGFDFDQFFANNQDGIKKALSTLMSGLSAKAEPQNGQLQENTPVSEESKSKIDESQAKILELEEKFAEQERQLSRRALEAETRNMLLEKGIPPQMFQFVIDVDLEKTTKKIDTFKTEFDSATKTMAQEMVRKVIQKKIAPPPAANTGGFGDSSTTDAIKNIIRR